MSYQYLGVERDDDSPNGASVGGQTTGCGCCSDRVEPVSTRKEALALLAEYRAELQGQLERLDDTARAVRKWKV